MSHVQFNRNALREYLHHPCYLCGIRHHAHKTNFYGASHDPYAVLLKDVGIIVQNKQIDVDHMWVHSFILSQFPPRERIYATGIIVSYVKNAGKAIGFTVEDIIIVGKLAYHDALAKLPAPPKWKPLPHHKR